MIKYKKGDLLEATENIIAHGCNCSGGFGSGVAGQIAKKWPLIKDYFHRVKNPELGSIQIVEAYNKYTFINCFTQQKFLPRGICHANYNAIKDTMFSVKEYAKEKNQSIAIPKIGAGLAGGDWNIIEGILNEVFNDYDVTVYEL